MKDSVPSPAIASKISQLKRTNRVSAVVGIVMLVLVVCIAIWSLQQAASTEYWVTHTYQVLNVSYQLEFDLKDTQASLRGYLLQPSAQIRSDFQAATGRINDRFASLKSLTIDSPAQQARLDQLAPLFAQRTKRIEELMSIRDSLGFEEAERVREQKLGKPEADRMWALCAEIQSEEYRLAAEREHLRHTRLAQGMAGTIGSAFLAFLALFVSSLQVRRATQDLLRTDQERHQSESMVVSLFEAAPEAILVVGKDSTILRTNPEIEHLFGYRREELIGHPVTMLVPQRFHSELERQRRGFFDGVAAESANTRGEIKLLRKGGEEFFAAVSVGRISTSAGTFAVLFLSDISQRRADEEQLRTNAEDLRMLTGKLLTAQEDERRRIARNLHDDLNQSLACLAMDLGRLSENNSVEQVHRELKSLRNRAREAAELVRSISHQLHPSIIEDLGLKPALVECCEEFQGRTGIKTHIECTDIPDNLPLNVESCIYYVVAECLRNVAKHSHGPSADVIVKSRHNALNVTVIDDGLGFSADRDRSGIGITTMRERLHLVGGDLSVGQAPRRGAQVTATVPLS